MTERECRLLVPLVLASLLWAMFCFAFTAWGQMTETVPQVSVPAKSWPNPTVELPGPFQIKPPNCPKGTIPTLESERLYEIHGLADKYPVAVNAAAWRCEPPIAGGPK